MRGRKPVPTPLKILRGNPGKRKLNDREPQPSAIQGAAPSRALDTAGRAEWRRVIPELARLGLLTALDLKAVEGYCIAYQTVRAAQREVNRGLVRPDGTKKPEVQIARDSLALMRQFMTETGLTAVSRARIHTEPVPAEDADEAFLRRRSTPSSA